MAINVDAVRNWPFPVTVQKYTEKDTILYALSLGYGAMPTSEAELRYVYEKGLQTLPTMAAVLCHPGFWISDPGTGIDASRAVHGEQRMTFHAHLPARGAVEGRARVVDIVDKGATKGALVIFERTLHDAESGQLLTTIEQRTLCRGDGGFAGSTPTATVSLQASASSAARKEPTHRIAVQVLPQAALIYRLNADMNPLHADPEVARAAGFERPIAHGMCAYGIAARSIVLICCGNDPSRLRRLDARFSAPVFPGETLCIEAWVGEQGVEFRCLVSERNVVAISNGFAEVGASRAST